MCVLLKHGLVVVSDHRTHQLHMHSLTDGSLVASIGSRGRGKGQFAFDYDGGFLCVNPDGDGVLVADTLNHCVQEMNITDGSWVRFVGRGVLKLPRHVDCNHKVIVVSELLHRVVVLSWRTGDLISQFGCYGSGPGQLASPSGVRLLADASSLIVADSENVRLCVFSLSGEFVRALGSAEQGLDIPRDVVECSDGFIVATYGRDGVTKVSTAGAKMDMFGEFGEFGEFNHPTALAVLPDGGLAVRDYYSHVQVFRGLGLRVEWITACVSLACGGGVCCL